MNMYDFISIKKKSLFKIIKIYSKILKMNQIMIK